MEDFENNSISLTKFQTENETLKNSDHTDDESEKANNKTVERQENKIEEDNNYGIYSRNQTLQLKKQKISFGNGKRHINFVNIDPSKDIKNKPVHFNTYNEDINISITKLNTESNKKIMTNIREESNFDNK